jgi:hypothetical protein
MFDRSLFKALMLIGIALPIVSCTSSPSLTSIVVTPSTMNFGGAGLTTQLTATGYYTHPNHAAETQNITDQVSWASSTPECVTVSSTGLITSGSNVCSNILVTASAPGFNGLISGSMTVNVTQPSYGSTDVVSVSVIPATQTVASLNVPVQYEAVGTTAGGQTVALDSYPLQLKWASSDAAVASINASTGLATTVGSGVTTITATFTNADGTGAVGSGVLTVAPTGSPEPLTSLTVSPNAQTASAVGQTAQFLAIATTGSGTSVNLTDQSAVVNGKTIPAATWTSSNPSVATINSATGVATSVGSGAAVITAIATNPDGTVVTGAATYTVSGTTTTSAEPLASLAIVPGTQTALAVNQTANFIAIGTTGSGTTVNLTNLSATINGKTIAPAVWSSSNPAVATVNAATGVATALSAGATAIVAIATNPDGTVVTGTAVYTVSVSSSSTTEPLVSLAIVPSSQTSLTTGASADVNFIAIGTTSTGATVNMNLPYKVPGTSPAVTIPAATWGSSNPVVASFSGNPEGVATPLSGGATAITAIVTNPDGTVVSASAAYTVSVPTTKEPLVSLAIVPASQTSLATGATANVQFIAIGTTSSGTTVDLTHSSYNVPNTSPQQTISPATWTSSNQAVAMFGSPTGGVATPMGAGATAITAEVTNPDGTVVSATAAYTVTLPATTEPYVSLAIVPGSQTATALTQITSFRAIATTGSGATVDCTASCGVKWYSSDSAVANFANSSSGVITPSTNGATAITAIVPNPGVGGNPPDGTVVAASASFTVALSATPEPLLSMSLLPSAQSIADTGIYNTTQFQAIGTFSPSAPTPGVQNMANITTYTLAWSSSNSLVATINPTSGVVTGKGLGTAVITAIATNKTDGSVVTANATITVVGPSTQDITSLALFPGNLSITLPPAGSAFPTVDYVAIGTNASTGLQQQLTSSQVIWNSTNPLVAQFNTPGVATALSVGTTTITAIWTNPDSSLQTATSTLTVSGVAAEPLLSVAILPPTQSVASPGLTSQLIAIGTFSALPVTQDVTKGITSYPITTIWSSSDAGVATVTTACPTSLGLVATSCTILACPGSSSGTTCTSCPGTAVADGASCAKPNPTTPIGLVTGVGQGTAAILAVSSNPDGTLVTATAPFTVVAGTTEQYTQLQIVPTNQAATAPAQTNQFIALATAADGLQYDVTNQVVWCSATPSVASIGSTLSGPATCTNAVGTTPGQATAKATGSTVITATFSNPDTTELVAQAVYSVTIGSSPEPLLSITIVPTSITVGQILDTGQFLAFGTFSTAPTYEDITNGIFHQGFAGCPSGSAPSSCTTAAPLTWISTEPNYFPINTTGIPGDPAGVATAYAEGTDVIVAEASNPDGTMATALATFSCPINQCGAPVSAQLATLTIYNAGAGTDWTITDGTGVIHCAGAGNHGYSTSVCEANYPVGATVTLTETPTSPTTFGGWSANCEAALNTPNTTPTCTLQLTTSETVGAIFN